MEGGSAAPASQAVRVPLEQSLLERDPSWGPSWASSWGPPGRDPFGLLADAEPAPWPCRSSRGRPPPRLPPAGECPQCGERLVLGQGGARCDRCGARAPADLRPDDDDEPGHARLHPYVARIRVVGPGAALMQGDADRLWSTDQHEVRYREFKAYLGARASAYAAAGNPSFAPEIVERAARIFCQARRAGAVRRNGPRHELIAAALKAACIAHGVARSDRDICGCVGVRRGLKDGVAVLTALLDASRRQDASSGGRPAESSDAPAGPDFFLERTAGDENAGGGSAGDRIADGGTAGDRIADGGTAGGEPAGPDAGAGRSEASEARLAEPVPPSPRPGGARSGASTRPYGPTGAEVLAAAEALTHPTRGATWAEARAALVRLGLPEAGGPGVLCGRRVPPVDVLADCACAIVERARALLIGAERMERTRAVAAAYAALCRVAPAAADWPPPLPRDPGRSTIRGATAAGFIAKLRDYHSHFAPIFAAYNLIDTRDAYPPAKPARR